MNIKLYDRKGVQTTDEKIAFAKEVDGLEKGSNYYILTHNNYPYDPQGPDSNREKSLSLKLRPTNESAFSYYTKYLNTRNTLHYTRTLRSFLNNG
tara:strand:- start:212 stop:496 length:285 start_codon:yes stop_codon:yes gene_type:complete